MCVNIEEGRASIEGESRETNYFEFCEKIRYFQESR